MEIDGPPRDHGSSQDEDEDDDASSEVSDGVNLKARMIFSYESSVIQLTTLITRRTCRLPFRATLTLRATMLSRSLFHKLPTLACTLKAWDSWGCHSVNETRNLLSDVLHRHRLVKASVRLSTPMFETRLRSNPPESASRIQLGMVS
jgi:hypothetical protein